MVGSADQLPRADPSEPCRGALLHTALPGPQPRPQRRRDPGPRSSPSGLRSIWGLAFVLKRPADMGLRPHQRDLTKRPLERRPLLPVEEPVQLPCRACERVIAFRTGLLLRCCCETRSMMDPICNRGKSAGERWLEMNAIAPIEPAHPRSLICFASGVRATLRSSCSPWWRSRMVGGPIQARHLVSRPPSCRHTLTWTQAGSHRFPGDLSHAFAPVQDPGRTDDPSPWRCRRCCPRSTHSEGSSDQNFEATHAASASAAYASRRTSPHAVQGSLPWPPTGSPRASI